MRKLSLFLLLVAAPAAAAPHPLTARDMHAMQRIAEPQGSPKGDRIAFTVRTTDFEANRGRFDIWTVSVDGNGAAPLTTHEAADTNPRWSPDGRSLYFLSTRSGSSQVWRIPVPGSDKDAVQVTDLPLDVANLTLSPDGSRIAFSLEVFADCPALACTKQRLDEKEKAKSSGMIFEEGFVRHWDAWSEGRRNHLFVASLNGDKAGPPVDVTRGMLGDAPSRPFGGTEEFAFTPDGKSLVFAMRLAGEKNREESWSTNFDLYQVPVDGSSSPRNLTASNPAWDTQPAFSPDGKTLAYLAMRRPGFEADRFRIMVRDLSTGKDRVLAEDWDRSANDLLFSRDGRTLYVTASDIGQVPLFAFDVASGRMRKLVAEGSTHSPTLAGDRIAFGLDTLTLPTELHTVKPDGSGLVQITGLNRERLADIRFGEAEQFHFEGANGDTVYGWAVKPVGFQEGQKYPLAFIIHGGPQGSMHNEFHYRWNLETYAAAGYATVAIDFHGSTGYGQAFTDAIRNHWGDAPLVDLQKGLAAALARYPWIDGDRACALGASYGGFMVNWIAGQWPDAFRCLVSHDGILDQRMMYYATEELWFPEWEQGGPYWQNPEGYEKYNPINYVERWKTPMLVVHSALDFRIPVTQGLGVFNALQRRGIPSKLLVFPDENHWVLKPGNSIFWHQTVLDWLARWTRPAE
ncbi:MAG TPA: S9 family peptidase [Thermoanaerobaculia bacterium]|jgi:dipeptidyl aminopeptidase/acylaminoacyl peptidase|nr:S9 family peptidase [Thermoanaerobaculia bacterium]